MTLLERLDAVVFAPAANIAPEDKAFCEQQEILVKLTVHQLLESRKRLEEWVKTEKNTCFSIDRDYRTSVRKAFYYPSGADSVEHSYDVFKFTPMYDIVAIENLLTKAQYHYSNTINDYFIKKYNLDNHRLSRPEDMPIEQHWPYTEIVEAIIRSLNGNVDFAAVGVSKAIADFRSQIYKEERIVAKGNSLFIESYVWLSDNKVNAEKNLIYLSHAIAIFETGAIDEILFEPYGPYYGGIAYKIGGHKIESVQFYKNRKLQIRFESAQFVKEFINYFDLNNL